MSEPTFREPRVSLNRIYTKSGDRGETQLASGERVGKDAPRIECYGTVDELNAHVGVAAVTARESAAAFPALGELAEVLERVQHELFNLGSILAMASGKAHPEQARISDGDVEQLERDIDRMNEGLAKLKSFVLPGGSRLNAELHVCRTVCRRAERLLVKTAKDEEIGPVNVRYLNRLSDAFFVWSRWANQVLGVEETLWSPNKAAKGKRS